MTVIISQGASKCLACRQNIVLCCHDHKRDVRKKIFTKTAAICTNALYIKNISVEIQQKLRRLVLAPTSVLSNESQTCNTRIRQADIYKKQTFSSETLTTTAWRSQHKLLVTQTTKTNSQHHGQHAVCTVSSKYLPKSKAKNTHILQTHNADLM